jgi:hypothetical protein
MFSDIAQHWARKCIVALAQRRLVSGYPSGTFRPDGVLTRAEFAALLLKIFPRSSIRTAAQMSEKADKSAGSGPTGSKSGLKRGALRDVTAEHWARAAIEWVHQCALLNGFADGSFRPGQRISRAQVVTALMAGLEAAQGVDATEALTADDLPIFDQVAAHFSDAREIAPEHLAGVASALKRKLLEPLSDSGSAPRPLLPNQPITRAEVALLLCRILAIPVAELAGNYSALVAAQDRRAVMQKFLRQEDSFNAEKLAVLDRGIRRSPYRSQIAHYAARLKQPAAIVVPVAGTTPYPRRGELIFPNEGALDFLSPGILSACVVLQTVQAGELKTRWLGLDALSDRQLWSATKFIPLLNVLAQVSAADATVDINRCRVREAGKPTGGSYSFADLATGILSYSDRIATSNALAVTFKRFATPAGLEQWTQQLTGNSELSFQGRYGEAPFIESPELWDTRRKKVLIKSAEVAHEGQNLVSTYDLTRILSMAGWHWQLPESARISDIKGENLEVLIRAMGVDTGRYVDVALETLGLANVIISPVIISKSGFGRSDQRDRTELTYSALVQFSLPRQGAPDLSATHQQYALCFTLLAASSAEDVDQAARYVDALMAAEVTEILRRTITQML